MKPELRVARCGLSDEEERAASLERILRPSLILGHSLYYGREPEWICALKDHSAEAGLGGRGDNECTIYGAGQW